MEGSDWLTVLTIVDDPRYLSQQFITSTHFKREADASGWNPTPCGDTVNSQFTIHNS